MTNHKNIFLQMIMYFWIAMNFSVYLFFVQFCHWPSWLWIWPTGGCNDCITVPWCFPGTLSTIMSLQFLLLNSGSFWSAPESDSALLESKLFALLSDFDSSGCEPSSSQLEFPRSYFELGLLHDRQVCRVHEALCDLTGVCGGDWEGRRKLSS